MERKTQAAFTLYIYVCVNRWCNKGWKTEINHNGDCVHVQRGGCRGQGAGGMERKTQAVSALCVVWPGGVTSEKRDKRQRWLRACAQGWLQRPGYRIKPGMERKTQAVQIYIASACVIRWWSEEDTEFKVLMKRKLKLGHYFHSMPWMTTKARADLCGRSWNWLILGW